MEEVVDDDFITDEIVGTVTEVIDNLLTGVTYVESELKNMTSEVGRECLAAIAKLEKPFKYMLTVTVMQRNGCGWHSGLACHWDRAKDGSATVRWVNETICCVVTVFGMALGGAEH